jgi:hypothetical protein
MKQLKILTLSGILASSLFALQNHNIDYISMSMGGAGVATSYGSLSAYVNPALVNNKDNKRTEFGLSVGIGIQEHELGDDLNKLSDAEVGDTLDKIANGEGDNPDTRDKANKITEALKDLANKENNYLMITPNAALSFKIGRHFALGIDVIADAKIKAVIDKNRLEYISHVQDTFTYAGQNYQTDSYVKYDPNAPGNAYSQSDKTAYQTTSIEYAMKESNTTRLDVNGISIAEIPLTYANNIDLGDATINWGITAKYMVGTTTSTQILFTDDDYDPMQNLDENTVDTTTFGVDAGLVIQNSDSGFKLAIAGKNLNSPEFDLVNGDVYKLKAKYTTGIAYSATDMIDIAIDYDLNEITDELTNQKYQYIKGGINFHPLTWFSLRAGARQNLADKDDYNGLIYTAGVGVGLKWLQVDLAAEVSQNSGSYDGEDIPRYAKVNLAIVSKWGDN